MLRDIDGYNKEIIEEETKRRDRKMARTAIQDGLEVLENATPEELELEASKLLDAQESNDIIAEFEQSSDDETELERQQRHEHEDQHSWSAGDQYIVFDAIQSRKTGKEHHARQATLDPELDNDDQSDYTPGFHITNRP